MQKTTSCYNPAVPYKLAPPSEKISRAVDGTLLSVISLVIICITVVAGLIFFYLLVRFTGLS